MNGRFVSDGKEDHEKKGRSVGRGSGQVKSMSMAMKNLLGVTVSVSVCLCLCLCLSGGCVARLPGFACVLGFVECVGAKEQTNGLLWALKLEMGLDQKRGQRVGGGWVGG